MNDVIKQIGGFYINSFYYFVTDSFFIHKSYRSDFVDNGFVGNSLGSGKNDYCNSGICYARFLALNLKYCLVFDDLGNILAK